MPVADFRSWELIDSGDAAEAKDLSRIGATYH